ncbi:hypothetical protein [Streptomyces globisporus]|uniref:WXG100 family type VII secretion target n=1 Tax=Streptomyces globisporus TaxID=1908 RepID=A0A423V0B1_STRGL|nr:hypothetical protein [Streptomyces globisporus]ROV68030.1 hypothetical protein D3105_13410 [Streptomyces globisporus]
MSDEKRENLTPAEQRVQDQAQVKIQMAQTDISEAIGRMSFASGPVGRTSFEGFQLNSMIDLVENTKPEDLENAGKSLWDARDAIKKAAQELEDNMKGVDWHGESGTAFRAFGKGLVAHARKLGDFADVAGTQITVAGTGLASVRSAMPPRDSRQVRKNPDDIELPGRVADNPEYQAALKVEKDRQEAINQINRLASYYSVSGERLEGQEPPRFEKDLGITMPPPRGGWRPPASGTSGEGSESFGNSPVPDAAGRSNSGSSAAVAATNRPPAEVLGSAPLPDRTVGTEINTVAPPQAPTPITATPPQPSPTPTTGPTGTPPTFMPPSLTNPVQRGTNRSTGPTGMPRTVSQAGQGVGKAQPTGRGPVAQGQSGPPIGRPGPMGGGGAFNGRPPVGPQSQVPTAGRSGVTGGRPTVGPGGTSTGAGPRSGGRNGIVGGTPQQTSAQARAAAGGTGQRGVIGGRGAAAAAPSRPGGRATPASGANGVVGAPRKAAGTGSNAKGFTAGGAGLVRGPAGRRDKGREDEANGSTRPDYLTEDEETWTAGRRGAVPPVVE